MRIDDLDAPRVRGEYVEDIFESLAWLGIEPDAGPHSAAEQRNAFSQTARIALYNTLLEKLADAGHLFACTCSRKDVEQRRRSGQYDGACMAKNIPLDTPDVSWRIRTPRETALVHFTDGLAGAQQIDLWEAQRHFVVRRRDGLPAYHIASLYEDATAGINAIVRGQDLLSSTAAQLYTARLLGIENFTAARFYHHPLLEDEGGHKLSKSAGSKSLKALRGAGVAAADVMAAFEKWRAEFSVAL